MHDCVIRSGTIIDGTGSPRRRGDVAIDDGRISAVGEVSGQGRREIDASDLLVTPGWVDVHTHYDGQATWDSLLSPSCWHGVTTIVMGNCGVGFAPARPDRHDWLIGLMEGVEDIPGTALAEGIDWAWESFPEYLDALERRPHAIDIGAQLPHGALRAYVMKERGAIHTETPSQAEIAQMAQLAGEAMLAGALGFTTSRTTNHRTVDGEFTPSLTAGADELLGIARGIGAAGCGVLQAVADFRDLGTEFGLLRRMAEESGRPLSISLAQSDAAPDQWLQLLDLIGEATQQGLHLKAQVPVRAIGLMMGLQASLNPFSSHPSYRSIADLPLAEKLGRMRQPEFRKQLLAEKAPEQINFMLGNYERMFVLGDPPDYEPGPEKSIAAEARRRGIPAAEAVYERLLENEGKALLYRPLLNYTSHDLEVSRKMLLDPNTVPGLSDAGAHCRTEALSGRAVDAHLIETCDDERSSVEHEHLSLNGARTSDANTNSLRKDVCGDRKPDRDRLAHRRRNTRKVLRSREGRLSGRDDGRRECCAYDCHDVRPELRVDARNCPFRRTKRGGW